MDEKIIEIIMDKPFIVPKIVFKNYKKLNISAEELIILIFIINLGNKVSYNPDIFVSELNIEKYKVMEIINSLSEKKLIDIIVEKNRDNKSEEYIVLDLLYSKILNLFKDNNDKSEKTDSKDIFSIFESEFGRTLSSLEYDLIKSWIDDKFSYELIIEALKEAIYNNVNSLSYIDRILCEWKKKGIKTKADVVLDKANYRNKINKKGNTHLFDYNWLDDE